MSLKIDITPLLKNVGHVIEVDEAEEISFPEDNLILVSPVEVKGEITNTGSSLLFLGNIKTRARLNCGRCGVEFDLPLEVDAEEEYSRSKSKDDTVFRVEGDNTIDLTEAVRQDLLTELPIQPLCDKKCKGVSKDASS